jgi:hypothetical protein
LLFLLFCLLKLKLILNHKWSYKRKRNLFLLCKVDCLCCPFLILKLKVYCCVWNQLEGLHRESLLLLYLVKSIREVKQQATDMRLRCADSRGTRRYVTHNSPTYNIHRHKIISVLEYEVRQQSCWCLYCKHSEIRNIRIDERCRNIELTYLDWIWLRMPPKL